MPPLRRGLDARMVEQSCRGARFPGVKNRRAAAGSSGKCRCPAWRRARALPAAPRRLFHAHDLDDLRAVLLEVGRKCLKKSDAEFIARALGPAAGFWFAFFE